MPCVTCHCIVQRWWYSILLREHGRTELPCSFFVFVFFSVQLPCSFFVFVFFTVQLPCPLFGSFFFRCSYLDLLSLARSPRSFYIVFFLLLPCSFCLCSPLLFSNTSLQHSHTNVSENRWEPRSKKPKQKKEIKRTVESRATKTRWGKTSSPLEVGRNSTDTQE